MGEECRSAVKIKGANHKNKPFTSQPVEKTGLRPLAAETMRGQILLGKQ